MERQVTEVEDFTAESSDDNALNRDILPAQDAVAVGKVGLSPEVFVHGELLLDDGEIQDTVKAYYKEVVRFRIAYRVFDGILETEAEVDNPEKLQLVVGLYCYAVVACSDYFAELIAFVTREKNSD